MEQFEDYRPLLFSIAYRMLGSAMEAEDIVQEAYLRYQAGSPETIHSPKAFLSTIVTRLCLDQLKSAQVQRENYVGTWLPEPLLTDTQNQSAPDTESISLAFLVLLESLTPLERAVFLLREVFDYEYGEIAGMVSQDETYCRQLFSRAKKHIVDGRPRFKSTPETHTQILSKFLLACQVGELDGLMSLLAEDVTSWSDGGGKTQTATRPIYGRDRVARYFLGITPRLPTDATFELAEVNNSLGLIVHAGGKPHSVLTIETGDNYIQKIWIILNPDKLSHV